MDKELVSSVVQIRESVPDPAPGARPLPPDSAEARIYQTFNEIKVRGIHVFSNEFLGLLYKSLQHGLVDNVDLEFLHQIGRDFSEDQLEILKQIFREPAK